MGGRKSVNNKYRTTSGTERTMDRREREGGGVGGRERREREREREKERAIG